MKKILFVTFIFICFKSFGQYPGGGQTISNDSTLVTVKAALKSRIINKVFTDTAQANTQRVKFYDGAQIITITGGNKFWIRDSTLNKWIQLVDATYTGFGSTLISLGGGITVGNTGTNNVNSLAAGYNMGITSAGNLITIENRDTLYILVSGQSNSNGYNDGLYDTARNEKVFGWNGSAWVILQRGIAPMGWCFPENSSGTCGGGVVEDSATSAGFYFAKRLQERTGKIVRVFFTGYGGEAISNWIPAASTNFAKIVSYLAAAGNPHIDYFIWQHGEANGFDSDTTYKRKVDTLVQQLDAQVWFGKDVPIFIPTVRDTATHQTMYYTQIAMGSGLYDKRYTTIDAGLEPYYNPAPYHFSAQGEYNIANKIIATLYNKLSSSNAFRGVTAAQQTTMETFVSNLGKQIITWDSTNKGINIQEISRLKTSITGGYFETSALFDSYGAVRFRVKNSDNVTGVEIVNSGLMTSGLTFTLSNGTQRRWLYQNTGGTVLASNTTGELQDFKPAVGVNMRFGEVLAAIQPKTYFGDATQSATAMVHIVAGNTNAGRAPLKFTAGTNMSAAEAGAMEWDGTNLFITQTTGPTRKTIAYTTDITATALSSITAATGTNTIDNLDFTQEWDYSTLSGNTGLFLFSNSTAAASNNQHLFQATLSGANSNASQTTYAGWFSNAHTGTTSTNIAGNFIAASGTTNIAGQFSASSGTNNYAIIASGSSGFNTAAPTSVLHTTSFATAYRAITALRTLDATDRVIEVTANTFQVTLPTAVGITGREYVITNSGSGTTTIGTTSSQTFVNVTATPTTLNLNQFSTVTVVSNGANWLRTSSL